MHSGSETHLGAWPVDWLLTGYLAPRYLDHPALGGPDLAQSSRLLC